MSSESKQPARESLSALIDGEWADLEAPAELRAACQDPELRDRWARYHLIRDVIQNSAHGCFDVSARVRACLESEPAYSNVTSLHEPLGSSHKALSDAVVAPSRRFETDTQLDFGPTMAAPNPVSRDNGLASHDNGRLMLVGGALAASLAVASFVSVSVWRAGAPQTPATDTMVAIGAGTEASVASPASGSSRIGVADSGESSVIGTPSVPNEAVQPVDYRSGESYWQTPGRRSGEVRNPAVEQRLNAFLAQHLEQSPVAERQGMLPYSRLVGYDAAVAR